MLTRRALGALALIDAASLMLIASQCIEAPELTWIGPFNGPSLSPAYAVGRT
ncbi:hypothetical protein ACM0CO_19280 [Mycobacteroides abscessus subsp. abscessus]|uniref:hypothetical protein n=1 Tax=Mycobacteroides abscessus TaxID=36809 RepID=UPI0039F0E02C